MTHSRFF